MSIDEAKFGLCAIVFIILGLCGFCSLCGLAMWSIL